MKQPLALRIDPDLLAAVRRCAAEENRTLTNFIETVLKARVVGDMRHLPAGRIGRFAAPAKVTRRGREPKPLRQLK